MDINSPVITVLVISYCLLWTLAYIFLVVKGFKDRTYGVPMVALGLNISWEFIFSFVYPDTGNMYRTWLYRFWFLPDLIIVYQLFRYGKAAQIIPEIKRYFYPVVAFTMAATLAWVYLFVNYYDDPTGTEFACIQNLIMSILFIFFYFGRRDLRGISIPAAWTKMIGTALASLTVYLYYPGMKQPKPWNLLTLVFILILMFDLLYIYLITARKKELARQP